MIFDQIESFASVLFFIDTTVVDQCSTIFLLKAHNQLLKFFAASWLKEDFLSLLDFGCF